MRAGLSGVESVRPSESNGGDYGVFANETEAEDGELEIDAQLGGSVGKNWITEGRQRGQKIAARSSGRLGRLLPFAGCKRCACPSLDRHRAHLGIDRRALADRKSARASDAHPIVILCV